MLVPVYSVLDATHVEFETNRHVAGDRGTPHVLDVWFEGDLVASVNCKTSESWFEQGVAKDLATIVISLEKLGGPMPVIPLAPYDSNSLTQGDMLFSIGCSDGRHPRARCGNVIKIENGLVYYSPESIPGDSGSAIYRFSPERGVWETVGRTAWAIKSSKTSSGWIGLAMSSDRIHDIKSGRVSSASWELPEGAIPVSAITKTLKLPEGAIRLDRLHNVGLRYQDENPEPLEVVNTVHRWKFPFKRRDVEEPATNRIRPLRNWNLFSGVADFFKSLFRYALITALILIGVGLYIAPTMLTPLSYDWPIKGFKLIFKKWIEK